MTAYKWIRSRAAKASNTKTIVHLCLLLCQSDYSWKIWVDCKHIESLRNENNLLIRFLWKWLNSVHSTHILNSQSRKPAQRQSHFSERAQAYKYKFAVVSLVGSSACKSSCRIVLLKPRCSCVCWRWAPWQPPTQCQSNAAPHLSAANTTTR